MRAMLGRVLFAYGLAAVVSACGHAPPTVGGEGGSGSGAATSACRPVRKAGVTTGDGGPAVVEICTAPAPGGVRISLRSLPDHAVRWTEDARALLAAYHTSGPTQVQVVVSDADERDIVIVLALTATGVTELSRFEDSGD